MGYVWGKRAYCDVCSVEIAHHHRARHEKSQMHQRLLRTYWEPMPSDEEFTKFLQSVRGYKLKGRERTLYRKFRAQAKREVSET